MVRFFVSVLDQEGGIVSQEVWEDALSGTLAEIHHDALPITIPADLAMRLRSE